MTPGTGLALIVLLLECLGVPGWHLKITATTYGLLESHVNVEKLPEGPGGFGKAWNPIATEYWVGQENLVSSSEVGNTTS